MPDGDYTFDDETISEKLAAVHVLRTHVTPADFDSDWFHTVTEKANDIKQSGTSGVSTVQDFYATKYNGDITVGDVDFALSLMKKDSSPGPDGIMPIMLLRSGPRISTYLSTLFQACWEEGVVPTCWKMDNRVYIPKPNKTDYHTEKAYRPLSLNSCVGKLYERTPTLRLIWFLECTHNIDLLQFAYRQGSNTVHALLHMLQSIKLGFNEDECCVAALIDLEGAFDAVWRDGVIYQLWSAGVSGRLLQYVCSFLTDRKSRNLVNEYTSPWIDTSVGVPQGSILAPILFIFYVRHMTDNVPNNLKYADDVTAMVKHKDPYAAAQLLSTQIDSVVHWNKKWRLLANPKKTEVMCFSRSGHPKVKVTMGNDLLKQVELKMCLGVTLDHNLNFSTHATNAASRAIKAIAKLSPLLQEKGGVSVEMGIILYKTYVRPLLEYAFPVWSCIPRTAMDKIERAQRIALLKITGCTSSTPTEALEVLTNTLPIQLRLTESACLEFIRLSRKSDTHPCFKMLDNPSQKPTFQNVPTPVQYMKANFYNTVKGVKLENLEKSLGFQKEYMRGRQALTDNAVGPNLGNSKSRTAEQKMEATRLAAQYLSSLPKSTLVCFTDGSALGNPGPCGAGAIIYLNGISSHPVCLHEAVAKKSTSYHGELAAVLLALNHLCDIVLPASSKEIIILSDCEAAINTICTRQEVTNHVALVTEIHDRMQHLSINNDITTRLAWIPGHAGVAGNELADEYAKTGATHAKHMPHTALPNPLTHGDVTKEIRRGILSRWQQQWDRCDKAELLHYFHPQIPTTKYTSTCCKLTEQRRLRLKSGFTHLNIELFKYKYTDSPNCPCNLSPETIEHVMLECPHYTEARDKMIRTIEMGYISSNCQPHLRTLDLRTLLGDTSHLPTPTRDIIMDATAEFIHDVPRHF